jgi:secreted trypsin-like serine protease
MVVLEDQPILVRPYFEYFKPLLTSVFKIGDSGGPAFNDEMEQIGTTGMGRKNAPGTAPVSYSNLAVYAEWIDYYLQSPNLIRTPQQAMQSHSPTANMQHNPHNAANYS